jgi:hypothetical protein
MLAVKYVLRQIRPRGKSSLADEATAAALVAAMIDGDVELGPYLEWSDPDANNGMGDERWTDDMTKAQRFASYVGAMECWRAQSNVRPIRPDGRPNRPLTAYSVVAEKVDQ